MKRTCMVLALLIALLMSTTALADTTSKNDMLTIQKLIADRVEDGNWVYFEEDEKVTIEDLFSFTLTNVICTESASDNMMDVLYFISLESSQENIGIADFGFLLMSTDANDQYEYHFSDKVYGLLNGQAQQLSWPVALSTKRETKIVLSYTVPKETKVLDFVYSNIHCSNPHEYRITGDLKVYTKYRTPMDFIFENNSGKTITDFNIAPASERTWGQNWLASYNDPTLKNEYWMEIGFVGTSYERRSGEEWEMRIVFEDDTYTTFSEIDLDDILWLELVPGDDDGDYTLLVTR